MPWVEMTRQRSGRLGLFGGCVAWGKSRGAWRKSFPGVGGWVVLRLTGGAGSRTVLDCWAPTRYLAS